MTTRGLSHAWSRTLGLVMAGIIVFCLDTTNPTQLHQLWLPLALTVAGCLMTRAIMAVAITTFALSLAHSDLEATEWVLAWAYPGIALISLSICCGIAANRFRRYIATTHDLRWASRHGNKQMAAQDVPHHRRNQQ